MPKIKPFKCFVYESRRRKKVVGEFVVDETETYIADDFVGAEEIGSSKIREKPVEGEYGYWICHQERTCLDYNSIHSYGGGKTLYGWHISELVIYDEPKELSEFYRFGDFDDEYCIGCPYEIMLENSPCENCDGSTKFLKKPPQSWYYVEGGVLISIRPEWWDLITSGKKTIEVRKSYPKKYENER